MVISENDLLLSCAFADAATSTLWERLFELFPDASMYQLRFPKDVFHQYDVPLPHGEIVTLATSVYYVLRLAKDADMVIAKCLDIKFGSLAEWNNTVFANIRERCREIEASK